MVSATNGAGPEHLCPVRQFVTLHKTSWMSAAVIRGILARTTAAVAMSLSTTARDSRRSDDPLVAKGIRLVLSCSVVTHCLLD